MRTFLKIFLTLAISLNLLGAYMPPKSCGMPCCQGDRMAAEGVAGGADASCPDCAPFQVKALEVPPCCKIKAASDVDPAAIDSLRAEKVQTGSSAIAGQAFSVINIARKAPFITGSPPGALASVPVYKLNSTYLC